MNSDEPPFIQRPLSTGQAIENPIHHSSSTDQKRIAAKSGLFDTSSWGSFCDVTLTLKQAIKSDHGKWVKIDEYECKRALRHFMNLLNRAVYGNAFYRHKKRVRVLPVLEKESNGRWHFHCAIEMPMRLDAVQFEELIGHCWAKVHWGYRRILIRDQADRRWIDYILKPSQKAEFDDWSDCIDLDSLHNPIADA